MKKTEAIELYSVLRELKNGNMSREALTEFILMRIKLKAIFDEYEKVRQEIAEQTKPEKWKEGDDITEWDKRFQSTLGKWLNEDIENIETNILSNDDIIELVTKNDLVGWMQDKLFEKLTK